MDSGEERARRVPPPAAPPNSYGAKDLGVGGTAPIVKIPRRIALVLCILCVILFTAGGFAIAIAMHPPSFHPRGMASAAEVPGLTPGAPVAPAPAATDDGSGPSSDMSPAPVSTPMRSTRSLSPSSGPNGAPGAQVPDVNGMCDVAAGYVNENGVCVPAAPPTGPSPTGGGLTAAQIAAANAQAAEQAARVQREKNRIAALQAASRVAIDTQSSASAPSPSAFAPTVPTLVAQAMTPAAGAATPSPAPTSTATPPPARASSSASNTFTLKAGDGIPVTLIGDLNAEQGCDVIVAQVREDVPDSRTHSVVLIPAGSRLIGSCRAAAGFDTHIDSVWQRISFPDDRPDVALTDPSHPKGLAGSDAGGGQGMTAQVDDHRGQLITTAFIPAIAAALGQFAQPSQAAIGYVQVPTIGSSLASTAGSTLSEASGKILQAQVNRPPTLRVASGFRFTVHLASDMHLPAFDGELP